MTKEELKAKKAAFEAKQKELNKLRADLEAEARENLTTFMTATLEEQVFSQYPFVQGVYWRQYTPYFNDGDTCEFSVNDVELVVSRAWFNTAKKTHKDDIYESESFEREGDPADDLVGEDTSMLSVSCYSGGPAELQAAERLANKIVHDYGEDLLKQVFGDHREIVVLRDGTYEAKEYDHE